MVVSLITKQQKYGKTPSRGDLVRAAFKRLKEAGIEDWRTSAEWLATEAFGCSAPELWGRSTEPVDVDRVSRFDDMISRRMRREPVQYIVGYSEFMGLRIGVNPDVLIPRPETEVLVDVLADSAPPRSRLLDIGTGSGCIALAAAKIRPDLTVYGCDVSAAALLVARSNALELSIKAEFFEADALSPDFSEAVGRNFDIIVSNPPYIPERDKPGTMPEVRDYEPHSALFAAGNGLEFYRRISQHALELLEPRGMLVFEIHEGRGPEVCRILSDRGFKEVTMQKDLADRHRVVIGKRDG